MNELVHNSIKLTERPAQRSTADGAEDDSSAQDVVRKTVELERMLEEMNALSSSGSTGSDTSFAGGAQGLKDALRLSGTDVDMLPSKAMALISKFGDIIDSIRNSDIKTIADVAKLVGMNTGTVIEAVNGLVAEDGAHLTGATALNGTIKFDTSLEANPAELKRTAVEEVSERFFQSLTGQFSKGDFGAKVAILLDQRAAGKDVDLEALQSTHADDTHVVDGELVEAMFPLAELDRRAKELQAVQYFPLDKSRGFPATNISQDYSNFARKADAFLNELLLQLPVRGRPAMPEIAGKGLQAIRNFVNKFNRLAPDVFNQTGADSPAMQVIARISNDLQHMAGLDKSPKQLTGFAGAIRGKLNVLKDRVVNGAGQPYPGVRDNVRETRRIIGTSGLGASIPAGRPKANVVPGPTDAPAPNRIRGRATTLKSRIGKFRGIGSSRQSGIQPGQELFALAQNAHSASRALLEQWEKSGGWTVADGRLDTPKPSRQERIDFLETVSDLNEAYAASLQADSNTININNAFSALTAAVEKGENKGVFVKPKPNSSNIKGLILGGLQTGFSALMFTAMSFSVMLSGGQLWRSRMNRALAASRAPATAGVVANIGDSALNAARNLNFEDFAPEEGVSGTLVDWIGRQSSAGTGSAIFSAGSVNDGVPNYAAALGATVKENAAALGTVGTLTVANFLTGLKGILDSKGAEVVNVNLAAPRNVQEWGFALGADMRLLNEHALRAAASLKNDGGTSSNRRRYVRSVGALRKGNAEFRRLFNLYSLGEAANEAKGRPPTIGGGRKPQITKISDFVFEVRYDLSTIGPDAVYNYDVRNSDWKEIKSRGGTIGSDIRIKQDIDLVGHHPALGVGIYSWRYRNEDPTRYVGVMAQDLLANSELSDAVSVASTGRFAGHYQVNYDKIGLKMLTEDEFARRGRIDA